jgi:hypothetical protein
VGAEWAGDVLTTIGFGVGSKFFEKFSKEFFWDNKSLKRNENRQKIFFSLG